MGERGDRALRRRRQSVLEDHGRSLNGGDEWTARAIADLNGDGIEDVIAGSFDYYVYAMSGADGSIIWTYNTGNRVFSVAPVPIQ